MTSHSSALIHASAVALQGSAVLLLGPSGSGKSDLALRLIHDGAELTSDDQTLLFMERGRLMADAPETIAGLIEMRGAGIVRLPRSGPVPVVLAVQLGNNAVPRLPEPKSYALPSPIEGLGPPLIVLNPFEASTPAKIAALIVSLGKGSIVAGPLPGP